MWPRLVVLLATCASATALDPCCQRVSAYHLLAVAQRMAQRFGALENRSRDLHHVFSVFQDVHGKMSARMRQQEVQVTELYALMLRMDSRLQMLAAERSELAQRVRALEGGMVYGGGSLWRFRRDHGTVPKSSGVANSSKGTYDGNISTQYGAQGVNITSFLRSVKNTKLVEEYAIKINETQQRFVNDTNILQPGSSTEVVEGRIAHMTSEKPQHSVQRTIVTNVLGAANNAEDPSRDMIEELAEADSNGDKFKIENDVLGVREASVSNTQYDAQGVNITSFLRSVKNTKLIEEYAININETQRRSVNDTNILQPGNSTEVVEGRIAHMTSEKPQHSVQRTIVTNVLGSAKNAEEPRDMTEERAEAESNDDQFKIENYVLGVRETSVSNTSSEMVSHSEVLNITDRNQIDDNITNETVSVKVEGNCRSGNLSQQLAEEELPVLGYIEAVDVSVSSEPVASALNLTEIHEFDVETSLQRLEELIVLLSKSQSNATVSPACALLVEEKLVLEQALGLAVDMLARTAEACQHWMDMATNALEDL